MSGLRKRQLADLAWLEANAHRSYSDIARELGCDKSIVSRAYLDLGIRRSPVPPEVRRALNDPAWLAARSHLSHAAVAREIGGTPSSVGAARRRAAKDPG